MVPNRFQNKWIKRGKILFLAFLIGISIRFFIIESVLVSTPHMEKTLHEGDFLFISKIAYGIDIPFSDIRLFPQRIEQNDIILLEVPVPNNKKAPAKILSRCVALPGDTIAMSLNDELIVNGKLTATPPSILKKQKKHLSLSRLEEYLLNEEQNAILNEDSNKNIFSQTIIIPKSGLIISLDSLSVPVYTSLFKSENPEATISVKNGKLYINHKEQSYYLFKRNYYWVLSDNRRNSYDSRNFGFVPESNIKAKALNVWMNLNFLK
ncbi:MAG: signal peptidase I [Bacteroidales bacterium]|nr:signal peptidase I [Bacteroidales bacterium]